MIALLASFFSGCAEVFFLHGVLPGMLLIGITLASPSVAATAGVALVSAFAFGCLLGMSRAAILAGTNVYNTLLAGCMVGFFYQFTPELAMLAAISGIVSFLLSVGLSALFWTHFKLPALSVPYVLVAVAIALIATRSGSFIAHERFGYSIGTDLILPFGLAEFLKALGAVLFSPTIGAGFLTCLIILAHSRILFFLALVGFYVGAAVNGVLTGSSVQSFQEIGNFNYILVAMSIGGVFLVPSLRSYMVAMMAVILAALVMDCFSILGSPYQLSAMILPFNAAALVTIYALRAAGYPLMAVQIGRTPEETLENHFTASVRFPPHPRTMFLPFSGKWSVWQAFDGPWTHKGKWKYAYDFVIKDEQNRTFSSDENRLEDYYCFQKPILSPIRGRVIQVVDHFPDNVIGTVDRIHNWGNYIILWDDRGFYVEISHLAQNSIRLKAGDWAEYGTVLGMCGNSGHSPQPHIHIQVQWTADPGAATIPFSFMSFTDGARFYSNSLPAVDSVVEPLYPDRGMDILTAHVLDQVFEYDVYKSEKSVGRLKLSVQMAVDGTYFLASERAKLYFGKHDGTFFFYRMEGDDPWLALLFAALPRLPLCYRESLAWSDHLPAGVGLRSWRRHAAELMSAFYPAMSHVETEQTYVSRFKIRTLIRSRLLRSKEIAEVELHPQNGICRVQFNGLELRRIQS